MRPYLEKIHQKNKGLVEWLKVKALSSSSNTAKQTNKQKTTETFIWLKHRQDGRR
jgi:hypothetical protein